MGKKEKAHRKKVAARKQKLKETQNYISRVWNEEMTKALEEAKRKQQEETNELNLSAEN